jgi:hypothetical protein
LQRSNVGGWHSEVGRLEFCGDAGRRLAGHMFEMADEATRRTLAELPPTRGACLAGRFVGFCMPGRT